MWRVGPGPGPLDLDLLLDAREPLLDLDLDADDLELEELLDELGDAMAVSPPPRPAALSGEESRELIVGSSFGSIVVGD